MLVALRGIDMENRPRIFLADDHKMITEFLAHFLAPRFDLVGTAENGIDLVEAVVRLKPDLAVVDISMPGLSGIEAAKQIVVKSPHTKLIFLTVHTSRAYMDEAFRAGASGYVLKRSAAVELVTAIEEALKGRTYTSPFMEELILQSEPEFTVRQREVLELVAEGLSEKEIAKSLSVSPKTVAFHKAALMEKIGFHSTPQLVRYALEHGFTRH